MEVKVLDVDPEALDVLLKERKATKVYDGIRVITHYDFPDRKLKKANREIKITEEGSVKLTFKQPLEGGDLEEIKMHFTRKDEIDAFLHRLNLRPVSRATSRRVSYIWEGVDIDVDFFPEIPPFAEIDVEVSAHSVNDIVHMYFTDNPLVVRLGTPDLFNTYGKDYFTIFDVHA
jgi:adenylate cyclase class IV